MNPGTWTLRGGTIVDGSGQASRQGNVVIDGDRISSVGGFESSGTEIDVTGLVVAPGFVDIHSHNDWIAPLRDGPELLGPNVQQGITTTAAGNCGISAAPLITGITPAIEHMNLASTVAGHIGWEWRTVDQFQSFLERRGMPLNLCLYVGHSTLRAAIMGDAERPPTPSELGSMQTLLEEGLRDGAVGLSIGLEYFPGRYAGPSEVEGLAALLRSHDGLFATHTRGISSLFHESTSEVISISERAGCRLQIAHVNPMGPANWDVIDGFFDRVDRARALGLDVGYDIVAYVSWTVSVTDLLPYFVQELGNDAVLALAMSSDGRAWLREQIEQALPRWPPWIEHRVTRNIIVEFGWDALLLADPASAQFEPYRGESLGGIARNLNRDAYDLYFDLILASGGLAQIVNVGYSGNFDDDWPLRRLMARPDAIPETDTVPVRKPNGDLYLNLPLFYGTMARFLGHFSRDLGLAPIEQAIRRITELPARRLRLRDRGALRAGAYADITVFDPAAIGDQGTDLAPKQARGITHVFVNGQPVIRDTVYDPERLAGRFLRRDA